MEQIYNRIGRIREYLALIESMKDECLKRFTTDTIYKGALLHYLYLLADSCISLAELVIKHKKLRIPQSYHEAIDILGENKVLEPAFAYKFARIAGFRNFLAHDYEKIDVDFICKKILSEIGDVNTFLKQIENAI